MHREATRFWELFLGACFLEPALLDPVRRKTFIEIRMRRAVHNASGISFRGAKGNYFSQSERSRSLGTTRLSNVGQRVASVIFVAGETPGQPKLTLPACSFVAPSCWVDSGLSELPTEFRDRNLVVVQDESDGFNGNFVPTTVNIVE